MIGLFDSGSGGLTVLSALRKRAPKADVVYFGDIANAPYGEREANELKQLTEQGFTILAEKGATEFVSACNSVSLSVLQGAAGHGRVIEMTRPTARALRAYAGSRALLMATPATVRSRIYADAIGVSVLLDELAVPLLAGAIERGASEDEIRAIVREALAPLKGNRYDSLILGCTHYPLAHGVIEKEAREILDVVHIIDPADAVAERVVRRCTIDGSGAMRLFISKDSDVFRRCASELFPSGGYTIEVI